MKGLAFDYSVIILVAVVVIVVTTSLIMVYYKQMKLPNKETVDVKYACYQYNDTYITLEDFKLLLYGFLTGQCDYVSSTLSQPISFDDIKNAAHEIDDKVVVLETKRCQFLSVSSHSVLVCCGNIEDKQIININRKKIDNSDVIICVE